MKTLIVLIVLVGLGAETTPAQTTVPTPTKNKSVLPECRTIVQACDRAQMSKNFKGESVEDCLKPILNGKIIKGVKIPPPVLKNCKEAVFLQSEADKRHSSHPLHPASTH